MTNKKQSGKGDDARCKMRNRERAEHAGKAIAEYLSLKREPNDIAAEETDITDLICDLFHLADQLGFDLPHILRFAVMHYDNEASGSLRLRLLL